VIETSGLALPKPLVKAFNWPEIRTGATVDGVVTVVDCEALANGQFVGDIEALEAQKQADKSLDHENSIEELFDDQLACADIVLLTKADRVDLPTQTRIQQWLQQELPTGVKVVPCHHGQISPDLLLGFNAAVEENLDARPSHHDSEEEHDHDEEIESLCLNLNQIKDPTVLVDRLQAIVQSQEIYRIKGFVAVTNKAMRLVVQGVGNRFETFYDRPWQPNEPRQTRLVCIGRRLEVKTLRSQLQITEA
jgi:cobalamin biosynthesis protein CobW